MQDLRGAGTLPRQRACEGKQGLGHRLNARVHCPTAGIRSALAIQGLHQLGNLRLQFVVLACRRVVAAVRTRFWWFRSRRAD